MFSQNFLSKGKTENICLIENHLKQFTDQSEVSALPAGCCIGPWRFSIHRRH